MGVSPQNVMNEFIILDRLDVFSLAHLLPQALRQRTAGKERLGFRYFSTTAGGKQLLGVMGRLGWMAGQEVDFSYYDIRDSHGAHIALPARELDQLPICHEARLREFESNALVKGMSARFDRERLVILETLRRSAVER